MRVIVHFAIRKVAAAEERRQALIKDMQERQAIAGARRLERLTPSPPVGMKTGSRHPFIDTMSTHKLVVVRLFDD